MARELQSRVESNCVCTMTHPETRSTMLDLSSIAAGNRYALSLAGIHQEARVGLDALASEALRWSARHGWPQPQADATPVAYWSFVQPPAPVAAQCRFLLPAGVWRLGRGAECDLHLDCPGISRQHAEIAVLPTRGARVRDLGSTNGTRLDGELLLEAAIDGTAVLDLGPLRLLLRPDLA